MSIYPFGVEEVAGSNPVSPTGFGEKRDFEKVVLVQVVQL